MSSEASAKHIRPYGVMRTFTTWSRFPVATCASGAGYDTALTVVGQLVVELTSTIKLDHPDG